MSYPVLYVKGTTDFSNQGLGPLRDAYTTTVYEERNGEFYLDLTYPVDGFNAENLTSDNIIKADAGHKLTGQLFDISDVTYGLTTIIVHAEHISYRLSRYPLKPTFTASGSADAVIKAWQTAIATDNDVIADSDIGSNLSLDLKLGDYSSARDVLGGIDGSILDKFGGEYRFDNSHVSLLKNRGSSVNTLLAYGRNITDFAQEKSIASTYTGIMPYATYTETVSSGTDSDGNETTTENSKMLTLPEYYVQSKYADNYAHVRIETVDLSDKFTSADDPTATVTPTVDQLRTYAEQYMTDNQVGVPTVSTTVSFVDLSRTANYADVAALENVDLCDQVPVQFTKLGINTTAEVSSVTWNVLSDSYDAITLGDLQSSLNDVISSTASTVSSNVATRVSNKAIQVMLSADGYHNTYVTDGLAVAPNGQKIGDLWYQHNGTDTVMYVWDGATWERATPDLKAMQNQLDDATQATSAAIVTANSAADKASLAADSVAMVSANVTVAQSVAEQAQSAATDAAMSGAKAISSAATALSMASGATVKVTSVSASVDSLAGTIQLKADQSVVDGLSKSVSSASAELTVQAGQIAVKADSTTVNSLAGTVSSQGTQLAAQAGSLALTVSKSDLTNSLAGYATQAYTQAEVTAASDKIQSTVSAVSAKVDDLSVGGRNYLLGSRLYTGKNMGSQGVTVTYEDFDAATKMMHLVAAKSGSTSVGVYINESQLSEHSQNGDQWVFSADMRGTGTLRTIWRENSTPVTESNLTLTDAWQRVSQMGTLVDSTKGSWCIYFNASKGAVDAYIKLIKVERNATVASGWTPAPEDLTAYTDTQVSTVTQTVTALQATVADKASTSQLTQISDSLTATIGSTGGPNLVPEDGWTQHDGYAGQGGALLTTTHSFYTNGYRLQVLINKDGREMYAESPRFKIMPGTQYTLTLKCFGNQYLKAARVYVLGRAVGSTADYDVATKLDPGFSPTSSGAQTKKYTFTTPGSIGEAYVRLDDMGTTSSTGLEGDLYFAEVQIRQGSIAPPYQLADNQISSQFTQLQDDINLRVSKGDVISQINLEAGKALIQSKSIYLDASTVTVGGTAFINAANIKSVNADTITAGTLDAANANVINLNASNITTGTIKGANLSINLSTGEVLFSKGQIKSTDGTLDINVDQRYISTANGDTRAVMRNGGILLTQPELFDSSQTPYLEISNTLSGASWSGATFKARDYAVLTNSANTGDIMSGIGGLGTQSFSGIATGKANDRWIPTVVGGADRGVLISGGKETNYSNINGSPYILVGANGAYDYGTGYGSRIVISADYVHLPSAYTRTTATSANMVVSQDGAITRATSASKYKRDIIRSNAVTDGLKLIGIPTATWYDIGDIDRLKDTDQTPPRGVGVIAEDLAAAGLDDLVVRGADGELEGVQYDRMTAVLLPLLKDIYNRLTYMEAKTNGN